MEIPKTGRADIYDFYDGVEIVIPTKTNWLLVLVLSFWMLAWSGGVIALLAASILRSGDNNTAPLPVVALFLCIWCVPGFFVVRIWLWNIMGKEVITFSQGVLTLDKKNLIFYKTKAYSLADAKNFRVQEDPVTTMMPFGMMRSGNLWRLSNTGTLRFDYGMETKKFAAGIDEAEAFYILQRLREKKLIT